MSRSALWRQEGNFKERERQAEEVFQSAVEAGRERQRSSKAVLPVWGPDDSFHLNPMLLRNMVQSSYFQKCCRDLQDWNAVVDEIYYRVEHLRPCLPNGQPGTAFCLLLRLLTIRVTSHQMELTLQHADSPYIRAIGFLYLRFAGPPDQIWKWIGPYVYDPEELDVASASTSSSSSSRRQGSGGANETIGDFVRDLFGGRDFQGTPLPRFPLEIERDLRVKLLQAEKVVERARLHSKDRNRMEYFRTIGNEVMALYGDDENPLQWYRAVVDRVVTRDDVSGQPLKEPKFVVTFPEYGNTETVRLGELDVADGASRVDDRPGEGGGCVTGVTDLWRDGDRREKHPFRRGDGRHQDDLYEEVRRRERETVTASKWWGRRPPTTKTSMSEQGGGGGRRHRHDEDRRRDRYRGSHDDDDDDGRHGRRRSRSPTLASSAQSRERLRSGLDQEQQKQQDNRHLDAKAPPRKRTAEEMAAIAEKKRRLMAKYG